MTSPAAPGSPARAADGTAAGPNGAGGTSADPADAASAEHARRASSFGAAASAYARHRPQYAHAAIQWALEPVAAQPGQPLRVLDIGAGTGKLTSQLAGLASNGQQLTVIAVEPDPEMLEELRRQLPGAHAMAGRAEAIPVPDASVDAVLAGQAAHWFDLDRAFPEIARVLRPGGVFAGLWNADDDRIEWVAGLHGASGRKNVATLSMFAAQAGDSTFAAWLKASGRELFSPLEEAVFENSQARTADTMIETMRTHSMFLVMEPPEREAVLAQVREYLAATPETSSGEFILPLVTLAVRLVRR
jgi:SAM-dependent methyltransferase